ncbi:hypothetical protein [Sorangium sp. So ce513]|uniref:hypothetical protein n=1 Tax=Sorangium sp. So ce513 TaxID=3133315 RepID=UPI003F616839
MNAGDHAAAVFTDQTRVLVITDTPPGPAAPVARSLQRAWTLARPLYVEVQELGLRFLRYDPQRDARFPSLYMVGLAGQGRKRTKKEAAAPAGGEGGIQRGRPGGGGGAVASGGAGVANGGASGVTAGAGGGATSSSGRGVSPATRGAEQPAPV